MSILKLAFFAAVCLFFISAFVIALRELIRKNAFIWLPGYLIGKIKARPKIPEDKTVHIIFTLVDHFEPLWNHPSQEQEIERVNAWVKSYPETIKGHVDSDGKCPQHTWFYPFDEFRAIHLEKLKILCTSGYGEIELHLHHNDDTPEGLFRKIEDAKVEFSKYGALVTTGPEPKYTYGFIHGNWSLDNSRKDGKWCGVNNELQILARTGCYADFTMPSAPSDTQTRQINSIYYAKDNPHKPKSHNTGTPVEVKKKPSGDLMIIQGPLCLNWRKRKALIFPTIENGNITFDEPPISHRIDLWIKQNIHVKGRPEWIFVKVYTHGAQDKNWKSLLGPDGYLDKLYSYLEKAYNDGKKYKLHYTTAREMYNIIKAAEAGLDGNPGDYRDYKIPPYINKNE